MNHNQSNSKQEKRKHVGSCLSDFQILSELGRGSYGIVYKVQSLIDKNIYVIKKLDLKHMKDKAQQEAWKEAMILKKIQHPHIIKYFISFLEEENLYIVMEYAEGGDLYSYLKTLKMNKKTVSEDDLWRFSYEITLGLEHLHENNIIHRDIKCLNIFITKDKLIKIGDLGVSKIVSNIDALICSRVGTPLYLSPELIKQKPYDFKVDLWALGCSIYHLAALEPPFIGENLIVLGNNIVKTKQKPIPSIYSEELSILVDKLLSKRPEQRPTIKQVLEVIPIKFKDEYKEKLKIYNSSKHEKKEKKEEGENRVFDTNSTEANLFKVELKEIKNQNQIKTSKITEKEIKNQEGRIPKSEEKKIKEEDDSKKKLQQIIPPQILPIENNIRMNIDIKEKIIPQQIQSPAIAISSENLVISQAVKSKDYISTNLNPIYENKVVGQPTSRIPETYSNENLFNNKKIIPQNFNQYEPIIPYTSENFFHKKRLVSSKQRTKPSINKADFRPSTANNRGNLKSNMVLRDLSKNKEELLLPVTNRNPQRPLTAANRITSDDKNIINININFYNIDLNQKYFDPDSKSMKIVNSIKNNIGNHLSKNTLDPEQIRNYISNELKGKTVFNEDPIKNKMNNGQLNNRFKVNQGIPVKLVENDHFRKAESNGNLPHAVKKPLKNNNVKNNISSSGEFIFKKLINSFDCNSSEVKKLTIKDFD